MNPGPAEEAGKVAVSFMDSMKANPVMLGMVAVILAMIGLLFYVAHGSRELRHDEMQMIFGAQKEVQQLLSKCTIQVEPKP